LILNKIKERKRRKDKREFDKIYFVVVMSFYC